MFVVNRAYTRSTALNAVPNYHAFILVLISIMLLRLRPPCQSSLRAWSHCSGQVIVQAHQAARWGGNHFSIRSAEIYGHRDTALSLTATHLVARHFCKRRILFKARNTLSAYRQFLSTSLPDFPCSRASPLEFSSPSRPCYPLPAQAGPGPPLPIPR
jgi:hypothetical protein